MCDLSKKRKSNHEYRNWWLPVLVVKQHYVISLPHLLHISGTTSCSSNVLGWHCVSHDAIFPAIHNRILDPIVTLHDFATYGC